MTFLGQSCPPARTEHRRGGRYSAGPPLPEIAGKFAVADGICKLLQTGAKILIFYIHDFPQFSTGMSVTMMLVAGLGLLGNTFSIIVLAR